MHCSRTNRLWFCHSNPCRTWCLCAYFYLFLFSCCLRTFFSYPDDVVNRRSNTWTRNKSLCLCVCAYTYMHMCVCAIQVVVAAAGVRSLSTPISPKLVHRGEQGGQNWSFSQKSQNPWTWAGLKTRPIAFNSMCRCHKYTQRKSKQVMYRINKHYTKNKFLEVHQVVVAVVVVVAAVVVVVVV